MKHIIAYIKPHKLSTVTLALQKIEDLPGMTVLEVKGFGRCAVEKPSLEDQLYDFVPHIKIEIFCRDEMVDELVATIEREAHTGLKGDGKIYVCDAEQAVRISTGERGETAV